MGKEEDKIINEANAAELARVNAEDLSMEGEAGQSATPQQAARGEAADGEPLRTAGGVSEQLEEAADMGSVDGLGGEGLIQFNYVNWKGEAHLYLIEPDGISFRVSGEDTRPHWYLHGRCIRRDGDLREGAPRRSFRLADLEEVMEVMS